jgi:antirestriction protein ArdC
MDENTAKPEIRRDLYQELTDRVIRALEAGTTPWQKPWNNVAVGPLRNGTTDRPFHGLNVLSLSIASMERNFTDPRWLSFRQATERGWKIRKGAKAEKVYFYKPMLVDEIDKASGKPVIDAATGKPRQREIPFLQASNVFNAQEIDGIPALSDDAKFTPIEAGEEILKRCPVEIRYGGNSAHYSPATDTIAMPDKGQFKRPEDFYVTLAHEALHSTSHVSRCNRTEALGNKFGDAAYSMEEMVAELGSFMLANETGLPAKVEHHASYIDHWLKVLKSDKKAIFIASAKASQACDFIMGRPAYDAKADASREAASESKAKTVAEAPKPEAKALPPLPEEIAKPASEALSAVSAKMKKLREKKQAQEDAPSVSKGMRM